MTPLNAISIQMFQSKMKISPSVLPVSLVEYLHIFKKMCFICNDKPISDNDTYNEVVTGRNEMDCVKELLTEWSSYVRVARAFDFMKPFAGLILFVIKNRLILLLSIHI